VELIRQQQFPALPEPINVQLAAEGLAQGGKDFRLAVQLLGLTIGLLDPRLGSQRASMRFQVDLAEPGWQIFGVSLGVFEEFPHGGKAATGHRREMLQQSGAPHLFRRRPAPAVAVDVRHQHGVMVLLLRVPPPGDAVRLGAGIDVVNLLIQPGRVRQHLRSVNSLPPEQLVWKPILAGPVDLARQKVRHAGALEDLRQAGREPEHVGQPGRRRVRAELLREKSMPVKKLANQRLARGDIQIRFHPHGPQRLQSSFPDPLTDLLIDRRVVLLGELEHLGLTAGEGKVVEPVHHVQCIDERARRLANRFAERPQPGYVQMRMPHQQQPTPHRERDLLKFLLEPPMCFRDRRGQCPLVALEIHQVHRPMRRRLKHLGQLRFRLAQRADQIEHQAQVKPAFPDRLVDLHQARTAKDAVARRDHAGRQVHVQPYFHFHLSRTLRKASPGDRHEMVHRVNGAGHLPVD